MGYRLELILLPVADVDRAKSFYTENVGCSLLAPGRRQSLRPRPRPRQRLRRPNACDHDSRHPSHDRRRGLARLGDVECGGGRSGFTVDGWSRHPLPVSGRRVQLLPTASSPSPPGPLRRPNKPTVDGGWWWPLVRLVSCCSTVGWRLERPRYVRGSVWRGDGRRDRSKHVRPGGSGCPTVTSAARR